MSTIDWIVLALTLLGISAYGIYKTRGSKNLESYLASNRSTPWWAIGLSIMATQASAITFISTPGMGYEYGLKFAQFYYGLPIAMVIIAVWFAPRFFHLKVFTAYEFLENRFNLNTRLYTAALFLIQRGLAAGVTIYAPSIILSQILGIPLQINILVIGILVIVYTVSGGTKAVTQTHKQQMTVIFIGLFISFGFLVYYLQQKVGFGEVVSLAKARDMLSAWDTNFDLADRYNVWSGLIGGTFLMLSYFGTDQSQVQRYLSGKSLREIRVGLFFNGVIKIPMQFFILFLGVLVFWFYTAYEKPVSFDNDKLTWLQTEHPADYQNLMTIQEEIDKKKDTDALTPTELSAIAAQQKAVQNKMNRVLEEHQYTSKVKETDFIFISWVLQWLPIGLVGLLLAVIFSAAMSSTSAELNALATTSLVDFYKRLDNNRKSDFHYLRASKMLTLFWGIIAIIFASVASLFDNLVEFVNILGSLFYGTILGIFLVAFYFKKIQGKAVLLAGIVAQLFILAMHFLQEEVAIFLGTKISFLWYNLVGCVIVIAVAYVAQLFLNTTENRR
jgi:Na+/proline symporter